MSQILNLPRFFFRDFAKLKFRTGTVWGVTTYCMSTTLYTAHIIRGIPQTKLMAEAHKYESGFVWSAELSVLSLPLLQTNKLKNVKQQQQGGRNGREEREGEREGGEGGKREERGREGKKEERREEGGLA